MSSDLKSLKKEMKKKMNGDKNSSLGKIMADIGIYHISCKKQRLNKPIVVLGLSGINGYGRARHFVKGSPIWTTPFIYIPSGKDTIQEETHEE